MSAPEFDVTLDDHFDAIGVSRDKTIYDTTEAAVVKWHVPLRVVDDIVEVLNKYEVDTEDGEKLLTLDEVLNNHALLAYLAKNAVFENGWYDPEEAWNNDAFCDWEDYR